MVEALEIILDKKIIALSEIEEILKDDRNNFFELLETYKLVLGDEEFYELSKYFDGLYIKYSKMIINNLSEYYFKMPIEMAIATKEQEKIKYAFFNAANRFGFGNRLQNQINEDLDKIADKLNRRFTFDDTSLIHLIEASKNANIQREELVNRYSEYGKKQIVRQTKEGDYIFEENNDFHTYSSGKKIPTISTINKNGKIDEKTTIDVEGNLVLTCYPEGKYLLGTKSKDDLLKEVMKNLFDNLNLFRETYRKFYTKETKRGIIGLPTHAVLADDSEFDFNYIINEQNVLLDMSDNTFYQTKIIIRHFK